MPEQIADAAQAQGLVTAGDAKTAPIASTNPTDQNRVALSGVSADLRTISLGTPLSPSQAQPKRSDLLNTVDRFIDRITEKRGRASITLYEPVKNSHAFEPRFTTSNFFAQKVNYVLGEAYSISKNNRGFTLYAMDENPTTMSVVGSLLDGSEDPKSRSFGPPGAIKETDWLGTFMNAYQYKLRASVAQQAGNRVFFSYGPMTAEVHVMSLNALKDSESPLHAGFAMNMVVKRLTVFIPEGYKDSYGLTAIPETIGKRLSIGGDDKGEIAAASTDKDSTASRVTYGQGTTRDRDVNNALNGAVAGRAGVTGSVISNSL